MRSRKATGRRRRTYCSLLLLPAAVLALSGPPGEASSPSPGCEPGGAVDLAATVVGLSEQGNRVSALIQVTVDPRITLPEARITARWSGGGAGEAVPAIPHRRLPLVRGLRRQLLYVVEAAPGRDHDLFFTLRSRGESPELEGATAHVRIRLDPGKAPRRRAGALEYRARVESGRAPAGHTRRSGRRAP